MVKFKESVIQKTLKSTVTAEGIGLHSGATARIELVPAKDGGIVFRSEGKSTGEIKALYSNVVETKLGTTIGYSGLPVISTIEHLMAAIWACGIDNLIVNVSGGEIPAMDGSSTYFIGKIMKAGIVELPGNTRKLLKIKKELTVEDGDKSIKISPAYNFSVDMSVEFDYGGIDSQHYYFNGSRRKFIRDISTARTFCNYGDIEHMKKNGLAKGGSLDNAMVLDENGLVNPDGLRYDDEVVRHKILDCVGDMFTSGYSIRGAIVANRSGHELNNRLLKKIFSDGDNYFIENGKMVV
ncbi:MAG: UDP-3-O-acyl-N-acetylglucosamine deacetylase [Rickettsiales bacterium]|jgi:UDP-3-O-[3-hydroxymyristoyl] N-acetylglucosamine deacetylase|nr:UDP-3-O-acyl-N-acetylglucosamine deacetylase [Rickettsiales bacterium]